MAKRNSTRHKARKPKFIEVEGHLLTKAQHAQYELCLAGRTRPDKDREWTLRLGLSDFLSKYRPSCKINDQLLDITQTAMTASLAIGTMRDYMWSQSNPESIRSTGCELVKKLALELYNASAKLTAIAMGVEAEETTKLQDWLAADERVARIGKLGESAHAQ
jgi:hypothetical protein